MQKTLNRLNIRTVVAGALFAVVATPRTGTSQASRCLGPDSISASFQHWAQSVVSRTDTTSRVRWHLPSASTDSVLVVTDSTTCANAINAYDADFPTTSRSATRHAYVIRVQDRYVVYDPHSNGTGEWAVYKVLSALFAVLASFAG
jgi:hypothetical protein